MPPSERFSSDRAVLEPAQAGSSTRGACYSNVRRVLSLCREEMGDVVNLNKFRKRKAKLEKERQAETNRRLHGRTKTERENELAQKKKHEQPDRRCATDEPARR